MKVVFSTKAIQDIEEIQSYIAVKLANDCAAINTASAIIQRAHALNSSPRRGAVVVDFKAPDKTPYRYIVVKNYLVIYSVGKNVVSIIRVVHGRMNYLRLLGE